MELCPGGTVFVGDIILFGRYVYVFVFLFFLFTYDSVN